MYALEVDTEPTEEPVSLAEAKLHCRIDGTEEDSYINALIVAARRHVESRLGQALCETAFVLRLDSFPCGVLELPNAPLISVENVKCIDVNGTEQTVATTVYDVDIASRPGRLRPKFGQFWPVTRSQMNSVSVEFTAGYGDAADVPKTIKQAILLLVGHWYKTREVVNIGNIVTVIPVAVDALLAGEWNGSLSLQGAA